MIFGEIDINDAVDGFSYLEYRQIFLYFVLNFALLPTLHPVYDKTGDVIFKEDSDRWFLSELN